MPLSLREVMDGAPLGPFQWAVAAMLTCVMILDGLDLQLAAFSAPVLMAKWQLTKPQFSPLLASAAIGMAFGTLIGSWAGDRYGRKPTIVSSVAFFGLMTIACAAASQPNQFVVLRFLSGLGFGAAFPVAMGMMSEWMPRRAAGKAVSIMTIGIPVGIMIGSLAASWLLPLVGWQYFFVGVGVLCILFSALLLSKLPESPSFLILKDRQAEARSLLSRAWGEQIGNGSETLEAEPKRENERGLFVSSNLRVNVGLWIAVLANSFATYAIGGWLVVILTDLHLPLAAALRGPLTVSSAAILGALIVGWLLARFGSRKAMLALALLGSVCAVVMGIAIHTMQSDAELFAILFVGLAIGGFCSGSLQPAFYVLAANAYGTRLRSRGIGVAAMMGRTGAIFSSFLGAAALQVGHASGFFVLVAALAATAAVGVVIVDRHTARLDVSERSVRGRGGIAPALK